MRRHMEIGDVTVPNYDPDGGFDDRERWRCASYEDITHDDRPLDEEPEGD